jgi:hypothetical protein
VEGVAWLVRARNTAERERIESYDVLLRVQEENEALKVELQAAQAELRAEREAKGQYNCRSGERIRTPNSDPAFSGHNGCWWCNGNEGARPGGGA